MGDISLENYKLPALINGGSNRATRSYQGSKFLHRMRFSSLKFDGKEQASTPRLIA